MSFLRRFVNLVVGACYSRRAVLDAHTPPATFRLHRINMSRFFYPQPPPPPDANAMVDARLPRHTMSFYAPRSSSGHRNASIHFMLLGRDKVLATDQSGHAAIYDPAAHAMRTAPPFTKPKDNPVSVAVGDNALYVLDTSTRPHDPCFEALVYERDGLRTGPWNLDCYDDWRCHTLPPRPFPGDFVSTVAVSAYTVVGGSDIWMSTKDGGTYSFDTARRAWAKQGDWTLPFEGLAEYVPEYNLWFGLSSTNHLCAFDLASAAKQQSPPTRRNVWEDLKPPKDWRPATSYLVHLGSGRFCVARFFHKIDRIPGRDIGTNQTVQAVFTGVEVKPCGKAGRGLRMIKHKSECYSLGEELRYHWVL
uniref:F-box associated domain-containing protein n=1 Tax=Oryza punctata TaxID=4537 RepID=A0A0E0JVB1_ORYPU